VRKPNDSRAALTVDGTATVARRAACTLVGMAETANEARIGLATDLYELTMAASYRALGMRERATFSLTVRTMPEHRAYLVAAGLEDALRRLEHFGFDEAVVDYVVSTGQLRREDAEAIAQTRFTGDVRAVPEGRVVFPDEPILEVDAPIIEAQLAETLLLNAIHFPTCVATKAARCVSAARGAPLIDFGLRRTPGIEAGLAVARTCFIVGFAGTSNVQAGAMLGIPLTGTVAHAFIEALPSERQAFEAWVRTASDPVTFLVDTYDTLHGVRLAVEIATELRRAGRRVAALRLDSGDLDALSRSARRILDDAGFAEVRLFASGGLDEYAIDALVRAGAPIDGFAIGTRIGMSADAPVLDMAYKIVAYAGRPCLKLSAKKATLVGPKQVWRRRDRDGRFLEDRITSFDEAPPIDGLCEPLLELAVRGGQVLARPSIEELRARHASEIRSLPPELVSVDARPTYHVALSPVLEARQRAAVEATRCREGLDL
jgi:nicotinate phosphoribosyltransferase